MTNKLIGVIKSDGDTSDWDNPIIFIGDMKGFLGDFNLDDFVDAATTPRRWLAQFGKYLLGYCVGYDLIENKRVDRLDSIVCLSWPWREDSWRPATEVAEPPKHPLDLDINFYSGSGKMAVIRYNLRGIVKIVRDGCEEDGEYLKELHELQAALLDFAADLQSTLDKGKTHEVSQA